MKWLYEHFTQSGKRDIQVSRLFGSWEISVHGCGQTTTYTNGMWKDAYHRLAHTPVKTILLLGLGAGGSVPIAYKQFPGCSIVAIEYDPTMITLARNIGLYKPGDFPTTIEGDAAAVVPELSGSFDLVVMDLFDGPEPSPLTTDSTFLSHIKRLVAPQGVFLANVYKRKEYLEAPKEVFATHEIWNFGGNTLGSFTNA